VHAPEYQRGVALFNAGQFFDAHEALEDVWREAQGRRKLFLQALIQIAVGLHHHGRGNPAGARSLLARGGKKLAGYPAAYAGLDVARLRRAVSRWEEALTAGRPAPPLPRLQRAAKTPLRPRR
jgi:predicted metal-dependent hydrolase